VPALVAAGETALIGLEVLNVWESAEAQRQNAAAIARSTNKERECKDKDAPPPSLSPENAGRSGAFNEAKRQIQ